jgi:uncharacterized protein YdeI (YjbR/CyaY-like superfamily)
MADLFKDIIPSILQKKQDILEDEKDYNPYVVNKSLSYHMDCILYANQMNTNYHLDKKPQYDYLLNIVRAKKRSYVSWVKPIKEDNLQSIKLLFGYSDRKAEDALKVLTDEQIELIKEYTKIGD